MAQNVETNLFIPFLIYWPDLIIIKTREGDDGCAFHHD